MLEITGLLGISREMGNLGVSIKKSLRHGGIFVLIG
jgi:hypothetical protein